MSEMYDRWRGNMGVPSGGFYHAFQPFLMVCNISWQAGTNVILVKAQVGTLD
jgi:hypothetical protein